MASRINLGYLMSKYKNTQSSNSKPSDAANVNIAAIVNVFLCLSIASLLIVGKGHNLAGILLLIPTIFFIWPLNKPKLPTQYWLLVFFFSAFFLLYPISVIFKGGDLSDLDQPSRFLVALLIAILLIKYPPKIKYLTLGFALSAIIAFIIAIIQNYYFDLPRAFTGINSIPWFKGYMPIQDGGIAMTLGLVNLCLSIYYLKAKKNIFAITLFISAFCGIYASILSGSRGAWVAFPIIILYLIWEYRTHLKSRTTLISIGILLTLALLSLSQNQTFTSRINQATHELSVFKLGNDNSSIGVRLVLWQSALLTAKDYPIFGAGYPERIESRLEQIKAGSFSSQINKRYIKVHAHNQYLEHLSVFGIIGLIFLLSVFFYPLWLHIKNNPKNREQRVLNQCGVICILSVMAYCLTQAFFSHTSGTIFYPLMVIIFLTASRSIEIKSNDINS